MYKASEFKPGGSSREPVAVEAAFASNAGIKMSEDVGYLNSLYIHLK